MWWINDPFAGTWRNASRSSARRDVTLFITKAGSGYRASLYILESDGGYSIHSRSSSPERVTSSPAAGPSAARLLSRDAAAALRSPAVDAPDEMVRTSTASIPSLMTRHRDTPNKHIEQSGPESYDVVHG